MSVVGDRRRGEESGAIVQYVQALCQEIRLSRPQGPQPPLQTVFFGGGTPSLLSVGQLRLILETLRDQLGIAPEAEISIEMDPGTFDLAQVQGYGEAGVNRISLGAQAFQPHLLAACGRTHGVSEIYEAVALVRQAGVENYSLDLISGLPGQTLGDWEDSLAQAIALTPQHLSAYDLVLEPVTVFGKRYEGGAQPLPSDDATAQMYRLAQARLTAAGFDHYEVSNYAKPGFSCGHNQVYWEMRPYYGFGMGAASYVRGYRWTRSRTTRTYYDWLKQLEALELRGLTPEEYYGEALSPLDELLETLMLGMRLARGVSLTGIKSGFGEAVVDAILAAIQPFELRGWVRREDGLKQFGLQAFEQWLCFEDPEGFLFSNQVLATLFERLTSDRDD